MKQVDREIKFRGKRTNERVYGVLVTWNGSVFIINSKSLRNDYYTWYYYAFEEVIEVEPETVGQYTWIKDKNGKEVYEGDIANVHHFDPMGNDIRYIGLVQFSVYWWTQIVRPNGEFDFVREYEYGRHEESLEIIGNIFENPDLLPTNETDE